MSEQLRKIPTIDELREAYCLAGDGADFKRSADERGEDFDKAMNQVRAEELVPVADLLAKRYDLADKRDPSSDIERGKKMAYDWAETSVRYRINNYTEGH